MLKKKFKTEVSKTKDENKDWVLILVAKILPKTKSIKNLRHKTQQAKLIRLFLLNYTLICYFKNTALTSYNMGLVI